MFPEVDPVLGPEMRSTGEVLGLDASFGMAFFKAEDGAGGTLPLSGTVLMTVAERDRSEKLVLAARRLQAEGFKLLATTGTAAFLQEHGIEAQPVLKVHEGVRTSWTRSKMVKFSSSSTPRPARSARTMIRTSASPRSGTRCPTSPPSRRRRRRRKASPPPGGRNLGALPPGMAGRNRVTVAGCAKMK